MGSNSILSQRTLREIYLRGFEIAVKTSQPMAIMTSYNLINGTHTANSRDLCTVVIRDEWGFQGVIITDWTTTSKDGGSIAWRCIDVGNDLIMPGSEDDKNSIRTALERGDLTIDALKGCAARILKIVFQTLGYEDCDSYGKQFADIHEM